MMCLRFTAEFQIEDYKNRMRITERHSCKIESFNTIITKIGGYSITLIKISNIVQNIKEHSFQ